MDESVNSLDTNQGIGKNSLPVELDAVKERISRVREVNRIQTGLGPLSSIVTTPSGSIIAAADSGDIILASADGRSVSRVSSTSPFRWDSISLLDGTGAFVSGHKDGKVRIWSETGDLALETLVDGTERTIFGTAVSDDGSMIAVAKDPNTVVVIDRRGEVLWTSESFSADGEKARLLGLAFSPGSRFLAAVGLSGSLEIWDRNGTKLRTVKLSSRLHSVAFDTSGALRAADAAGKVYEVTSGDGWASEPRIRERKLASSELYSLTSDPSSSLSSVSTGDGESTIVLDSNLEPRQEFNCKSLVSDSSFREYKERKQVLCATQKGEIGIWALDSPPTTDLGITGLRKATCDWLGDYLAINPSLGSDCEEPK